MTLKLTANVPLKIGQNPKRETIVFQPSIFRCELLVLGGYPVHLHIKKISNKYVYIYMSYQLQILHKHGWMDTETWWANGVFPGIFFSGKFPPKTPLAAKMRGASRMIFGFFHRKKKTRHQVFGKRNGQVIYTTLSPNKTRFSIKIRIHDDLAVMFLLFCGMCAIGGVIG